MDQRQSVPSYETVRMRGVWKLIAVVLYWPVLLRGRLAPGFDM